MKYKTEALLKWPVAIFLHVFMFQLFQFFLNEAVTIMLTVKRFYVNNPNVFDYLSEIADRGVIYQKPILII